MKTQTPFKQRNPTAWESSASRLKKIPAVNISEHSKSLTRKYSHLGFFLPRTASDSILVASIQIAVDFSFALSCTAITTTSRYCCSWYYSCCCCSWLMWRSSQRLFVMFVRITKNDYFHRRKNWNEKQIKWFYARGITTLQRFPSRFVCAWERAHAHVNVCFLVFRVHRVSVWREGEKEQALFCLIFHA